MSNREPYIPGVIDLRESTVGLSCQDYETLYLICPPNLPGVVERAKIAHANACAYHSSSGFRQSMIDMPLSPGLEQELEEEARQIIEKITSNM